MVSSSAATTGQGRRLICSYLRAPLTVDQFSVTMLGQIRSCSSLRTYSNPVPAGEHSHLCDVVAYVSTPRSRTLTEIIPGTCAPSTKHRSPLLCASAAISLIGVYVPVTVSQ